MATIDWPRELTPQSSDFGVNYNNMVFTSIFTNSDQTVSFPGDFWQLSMTLPPLGREKERLLAATLGQLRGMVNHFRFRDRRFLNTTNIGSPIVNGAGQTGINLATRLWPANTRVLRLGDYVTVADQLFQMTADVTSDSAGNAVLPLNMMIRESPEGGAAINYNDPYCVMRLTTSSNQIKRQVGQAGITLNAREAF